MPKKKSHRKQKNSRRKWSSLIWLVLSIALVGGGVYAGIYLEKNTVIQEVRFQGNSFTDDSTLTAAIESPVGVLADSVHFSGLVESLKSVPYVKDVSMNMNIRGTLTFTVEERDPIAMLIDGNQRTYVGEGGVILPVIPGKIRNVPLLYGFSVTSARDTLSSDEFKQVEEFLTEAKSNEISWVTISEVAWNEREGVIALTYENGVKLIFGRDNFREKVRNWEAFYTNIVTGKGIQTFRSVDLRFEGQVVTQHI
ncbi:MAG: cell division protein FtsQ/DivIB [Balneolaceae bacterium]|nr:cell division protein FtsQ/DivIB [Balneolaceae bacterium]